MTDDRLTNLLAEAADLAPSAALRARVAEFRPRRRTPWLALSGVSATLAGLAFLALPREISAAELGRRADRAIRASGTYRIRSERFLNGAWRLHHQVLNTPDGQLCRWPDGRFQIRKPGALYTRFDRAGPIRLSRHVRIETGAERAMDEDPSPENHRRLLQAAQRGRPARLVLSLGRLLQEHGRRLREVAIVGPSTDRTRTRYLIDESTSLPVRMEQDVRIGDAWRPSWRKSFTFGEPPVSNETFAALLRSAPIVDVDAERARWTRRLAPVRRTLRPPYGEPLAVRDLRTLPNGDVVMLYTGPQRALASLEGAQGETFALRRSIPRTGIYPDHRHPVRLLHFVPLRGDAVASRPLRLRLFWNGRSNGAFRIEAPLQAAATPPWAVALDAAFDETSRDQARVTALADRWLDARGRRLEGRFGQDPDADLRTTEVDRFVPPPGAVRPDPKASAEAAVVMRRLIARLAAQGEEEDPEWTARLLTQLERRAKG